MNNSWFKKKVSTNSNKENMKAETKSQDTPKEIEIGTVITIGRELGSGGRKIAKKLAEKLNYKYYDKEIITKAAKDSGIDEELFKQVDEADLDNFWFDFSKESYTKEINKSSFKEATAADKLFMIQSDTICEIAKNGNAVIVGRCSTYILKNESKRVFICANATDRIERIMRIYSVTEDEAKSIMQKSDKKRENYHKYYTNRDWKDKNGYDLVINTSEVGVEKAVKMIIDLI